MRASGDWVQCAALIRVPAEIGYEYFRTPRHLHVPCPVQLVWSTCAILYVQWTGACRMPLRIVLLKFPAVIDI